VVRGPQNRNRTQFVESVGFVEFVEERQEGVHSPQSIVQGPQDRKQSESKAFMEFWKTRATVHGPQSGKAKPVR